MDDHPVRTSLFRLSSEIDTLLVKECEYKSRIEELSTNLAAFRAAYTSSQDEIKSKTEEATVLLAELHALKGHEKRVICLLDGDGTIFSPEFIALGQEGGLEAARLLTEKVRYYLAPDLGHEKFHFWVYLFYNKRGLLETFARVGLSAAKQRFEDFILGFNQAAERFLMVDVGGSKEAADAKIKVHLEDNIRLPQTYKIIFGGSHDNGYVNILRSVITEGFRDKLILLPGYSDVALDIKALGLPELRIPNLFISSKLVPPSYISIASGPPPGLPSIPSRQPASSAQTANSPLPSGLVSADTTNTIPRRNSIQTYKSALQTGHNNPIPYEGSDSSLSTDATDAHPAQVVQFTRRLSSPGRQRRINPNLSLSKQNPAPCTLFYLAQCRHGSDCKYGHDYILEIEHYEELSENAKKTPCKVTNEGGICTFGDDCVYGHVCPQGTTCYFLKLGKCKFQAGSRWYRPIFHSLKRVSLLVPAIFFFTLLAFIMATPQVTEALIQRSPFLLARDDSITRLLTLSSTTIKRNVDLENRLAELEVELAVWKQAHATALEGAEREAKTLKGRLASLSSQITSMESLMVRSSFVTSRRPGLINAPEHEQSQSLLILCVIDGDACLFSESLLKQGHEGGRQAAQQLTKAVADYLTSQDVHILGRLSFWITVYYNRVGLTSLLERHQICTPEQLDAFTMGFSQASPRFLLVDVGYGKDATFTKITEYLQTYIRFPQTQRIFLAGGSDSAYASTIPTFQNEGLLGKLTFLEAAGGTNHSPRFRLPTLYVDNLFMAQQATSPTSVTHLPPPLNITGLSPSYMTGGLPTPRSPPSVPSPSSGKLIDPNLASIRLVDFMLLY
ncbi:hypothetical protein JVU11DRAFT_1810 [Chiua virens]|nr:hypothetical protein JVU11DRAFT_1810 [Chiua virens]